MRLIDHIDNIHGDKNYRYTYVVAEIGINHNGDFNTARDLIIAANNAGVDAVKFQLRDLDEIYTKDILDDPNSAEWNFEYIVPILKESQFSIEEMKELVYYTKAYGMECIITPFDKKSVKICAEELHVDAFKIGSMDMTNYKLIEQCHEYGIPIIISTGMWTEQEIEDAKVQYALRGMEDGDYFLLLANSTYPTPYESINLEFLNKLKKIHPFIGYSGHERGTFIPVAAAAIGARIIEKHITFDRNQKGPDHKASMLPEEFNEMVDSLRKLEKAVGSNKVVNNAEQLAKQTFVRAAYARYDLKEGHVLELEDLEFKVPGKGILMHEIDKYIAKPLLHPVKKGSYLTPNDFFELIPIETWTLPKFSKDWGVKCRFHDYDEYSKLNSPVIEFHMSETDLNVEFNRVNPVSQLIVHAPEVFDKQLVDICSTNRDVLNGSIDLLQRSIDKTLKLGKGFRDRPKFVVHLGGMSLDDVFNGGNQMMYRAIDNFKKLKFNPDDIEILPENLPPRPWYLGGQYFQYGFMEAEHMIAFCKFFDLNMTLDVCHAALHCNHNHTSLDEYVKKLLDISSHFHLSDAIGIDGEGVQIGEGTINFESLMAVLKQKNGPFSWVTEIWSAHVNHGAGCRQSMHSLGQYNHII